MEHRVRVPLEQEHDCAAVDDDAGDHEDQDRDVGWGPSQGQAFNHGLHPGPRTHLNKKNRSLFFSSEFSKKNCLSSQVKV